MPNDRKAPSTLTISPLCGKKGMIHMLSVEQYLRMVLYGTTNPLYNENTHQLDDERVAELAAFPIARDAIMAAAMVADTSYYDWVCALRYVSEENKEVVLWSCLEKKLRLEHQKQNCVIWLIIAIREAERCSLVVPNDVIQKLAFSVSAAKVCYEYEGEYVILAEMVGAAERWLSTR